MNRRLTISGLVGAANFIVPIVVFRFVHFHSTVIRHTALIYGVLFGVINAMVMFGIWPALREFSDQADTLPTDDRH